MPHRTRWTKEEVAVVAFARSRGATLAACKSVLEVKFPSKHAKPRSQDAIAVKLQSLYRLHKLLDEKSRKWSREATDTYLKTLDLPNLTGLTSLGPKEKEFIEVIAMFLFAARHILSIHRERQR